MAVHHGSAKEPLPIHMKSKPNWWVSLIGFSSNLHVGSEEVKTSEDSNNKFLDLENMGVDIKMYSYMS